MNSARSGSVIASTGWMFFRYSGAGALGTGAHYGLLVVLVELCGLNAAVAAVGGALTGALVNYCLNYRYTFRSAAGHRLAGIRFALVAFAGAALNGLIVAVLVSRGLNYLLAQLVATGVVLALGFFGNRHWTFASGKPP